MKEITKVPNFIKAVKRLIIAEQHASKYYKEIQASGAQDSY